MRRRGRPVMGALFGLVLGFLVSLDLFMFDVRPLDTFGTVGLPLIGLALGLLIGFLAPFGRSPDSSGRP